jgi:hypothetical protein
MTDRLGLDVWYTDAIQLKPGDGLELWFESTNSPHRQGVFLATEGVLAVADHTSRAFRLWADTAPRPVVIRCVETALGELVVHNVYQAAGRSPMSQAHTSGMLIEELAEGGRRYRCCDAGAEPTFDRLTFSIRPIA